MINLTQVQTASPRVHDVSCDPGREWVRPASVAIDAAPDEDTSPAPEATWAADAVRTGLCGAVSPRVVRLSDGRYRVFYSQILPRAGFPAGANDYDNSTTRILSAVSADGLNWTPEPGVRLSAEQGGAGEFRVVSSEVVPMAGDTGRFRMFFECCPGPQSVRSAIRSAVSDDDGVSWNVEPGERLAIEESNISSPRIVFLDDGRWRMYLHQRGVGVVSAVSVDGGTTFELEAGVRIAETAPHATHTAFASEILRLGASQFRMYFAAYSRPQVATVMTAVSQDGLEWVIDPDPVLSPTGDGVDAAKCSEMCVLELPGSTTEAGRFAMLYEACDGTAADQRGVWRVACVVTQP
ncbi:MAG TPA: hypothetical protein DER64_17005 [Planctomycetaceae bacterium]|nr:hypothetical protein [Planctomycetaceae bacterium]|tara:strand:+ start:2339 stop:3391 length:1053 start_codon:yes stop_codon:yes gene_type:complete